MNKFSAVQTATEFEQPAEAAHETTSVAMARVLRDELAKRYRMDYPTAMRRFEENFEACIA